AGRPAHGRRAPTARGPRPRRRARRGVVPRPRCPPPHPHHRRPRPGTGGGGGPVEPPRTVARPAWGGALDRGLRAAARCAGGRCRPGAGCRAAHRCEGPRPRPGPRRAHRRAAQRLPVVLLRLLAPVAPRRRAPPRRVLPRHEHRHHAFAYFALARFSLPRPCGRTHLMSTSWTPSPASPPRHRRVPTPLGDYLIAAEGGALTGVWREAQSHFPAA